MDWLTILITCGVKPATAARWAEVFETADLPQRGLSDFLGQVLHESGHLERLVENLNYSAERLCVVWPSRFPNIAAAAPFARNPQALANKVYGGRMGNTEPDDGWRYRGRGLLQVTGLTNYARVQEDTGLPVVANPDMLAQPGPALQASVAWWRRNMPDNLLGNVEAVSKRVNGGTAGLGERRQLTLLAASAMPRSAA